MEITQQSILRQAMRNIELSKNGFAKAFNISRRKLDSWLLPKDSPGFTEMPLEMQGVIYNTMRAQELKESRDVMEGTLSPDVSAIHSDTFDFDFPTLYRITYASEGGYEMRGIPRPVWIDDPDDVSIIHGYALCETPDISHHKKLRIIKSEPVLTRNNEDDAGHLFINEHRSLDRSDAFIKAIINTQMENFWHDMPTVVYSFKGRIFTLIWLSNPQDENDYKTSYTSDMYLKIITPHVFHGRAEYSYIDMDVWGVDFGKNEEIQSRLVDGSAPRCELVFSAE